MHLISMIWVEAISNTNTLLDACSSGHVPESQISPFFRYTTSKKKKKYSKAMNMVTRVNTLTWQYAGVALFNRAPKYLQL